MEQLDVPRPDLGNKAGNGLPVGVRTFHRQPGIPPVLQQPMMRTAAVLAFAHPRLERDHCGGDHLPAQHRGKFTLPWKQHVGLHTTSITHFQHEFEQAAVGAIKLAVMCNKSLASHQG